MYYLKRNHDATRNFWKCAKRSNNFGLQWPSTCFGLNRDLQGASWIACCPSTFCTRFPYYPNKSNQVISIYLTEIFCFCCSLADIIYFSHSRLGEIHQNGPSAFCRVSINKKSNNCPSRVSWVAKLKICNYWNFQDSINAVQLLILCYSLGSRPWGLNNLCRSSATVPVAAQKVTLSRYQSYQRGPN